ncbi:hypothetical protein HaLaN_02646, partial [Haematococcus lacustris]
MDDDLLVRAFHQALRSYRVYHGLQPADGAELSKLA